MTFSGKNMLRISWSRLVEAAWARFQKFSAWFLLLGVGGFLFGCATPEEQKPGYETRAPFEPRYGRGPTGRQPVEETGVQAESPVGRLRLASEILGKEVENPEGQTLGEVEDFLVDLDSGRIPYAVISQDTLFDFGEKKVVVPAPALTQPGPDAGLQLQTTREELADAPDFNPENLEQYSNPVWGARRFQDFGQEPYWKSLEPPKRREKTEEERITPFDQGSGGQDRRITTEIRRAVMKDPDLTFTAKNVKIITREGRVTLHGVVATQEEKQKIEAHAREVAGATNVNSKIELLD